MPLLIQTLFFIFYISIYGNPFPGLQTPVEERGNYNSAFDQCFLSYRPTILTCSYHYPLPYQWRMQLTKAEWGVGKQQQCHETELEIKEPQGPSVWDEMSIIKQHWKFWQSLQIQMNVKLSFVNAFTINIIFVDSI